MCSVQSGALRRSFSRVTETTAGRKPKLKFAVKRAQGELPMSDFFLDDFAARQWDDPEYVGTRMPSSTSKDAFCQRLHEYYEQVSPKMLYSRSVWDLSAITEATQATQGTPLVDGYAPFCKHVFVPNFPGCLPTSLRITEDNQHLLQSGYLRRRPEELAVLSRYTQLPATWPAPTH